jgi:pimeloyl-ACP methyl ester carboxylesterase
MYPLVQKIFTYPQTTVIPDSGHWLHVEQPELFLTGIKDFLKK